MYSIITIVQLTGVSFKSNVKVGVSNQTTLQAIKHSDYRTFGLLGRHRSRVNKKNEIKSSIH
jgi:hypothetical protein